MIKFDIRNYCDKNCVTVEIGNVIHDLGMLNANETKDLANTLIEALYDLTGDNYKPKKG